MTLLEDKAYGHQLINLVAEKHDLALEDVYWNMSRYLNRPEPLCHFSKMGKAETEEAINGLRRMLKVKKTLYKKGCRPRKKKNQLPVSEIKRLTAKLPKVKKLPFWERLFRRLKYATETAEWSSHLKRHRG